MMLTTELFFQHYLKCCSQIWIQIKYDLHFLSSTTDKEGDDKTFLTHHDLPALLLLQQTHCFNSQLKSCQNISCDTFMWWVAKAESIETCPEASAAWRALRGQTAGTRPHQLQNSTGWCGQRQGPAAIWMRFSPGSILETCETRKLKVLCDSVVDNKA